MSNKRYNVGVVGAGGVTNMHLDGLCQHPERVQVKAICDVNEQALNAQASKYKVPQTYTDLGNFIHNSDIDVAVVCTPSNIRKDILLPLIQAGIPVLSEKPLTENLQDAKEILEASEKHSVPVAVNQNFRTFYSFNLVKELIEKQTIGNVQSILMYDMMYRQDQGWRIGCERHSLAVMGIHWLDGFRQILNSEATSLVCQVHSSPALDCKGDSEAHVQIVFENGTKVTYVESFTAPKSLNELRVVGETGMLVANYKKVDLYRKEKVNVIQQSWDNQTNENKPESAFQSLDLLLNSIETGIKASNSIHDVIKTVALMEACYKSAEKQQIVTFDSKGMVTV